MTHVGIIGAGGISHAHAPGWLARASRITICSLAGAEDLAEEITRLASQRPVPGTPAPVVDICPELEQVLDTVDVVDVCTPTDTHAAITQAALEHGRHVLCEKPLTRHSAQAQPLIDLASARGLVLYPAHVVRFFPAYVQARRAVQDGTVGALAVARYRRLGSFPSWSDWFGDESRSGGLVMDLLIHDLDQAVWTAGPVTEVFASLARRETAGHLPVELVDAVLTHASGAISQVQAVWGPPGMEFTTELHLAGTAGTLHYASREDTAIRTNGGPTGPSIVPQTAGRSPYVLEIEDFLATVANPAHAPVVTAADGLAAVRLAEAVTDSALTGRPVRLSDGEPARPAQTRPHPAAAAPPAAGTTTAMTTSTCEERS